MAPPRKNARLDNVSELIKAMNSIKITIRPFDVAKASESTKFMQNGIRLGEGVIGTPEEEEAFISTVQEQEKTEKEQSTPQITHKASSFANDTAIGGPPAQDIKPKELNESTENSADMAKGSLITSSRNVSHEEEAEGEEEGGEEDILDSGDSDDLDDYQDELGSDLVYFNEEEFLHLSQYFRGEWEELIHELHNIEAYKVPGHMPTRPHDYQLKDAAQIGWLCKSAFRGCLLGNPMGLGKTLTSILHMWKIKDEVGMSLVVCPATLCTQWVDAIHGAFDDGFGLSAFHLRDPKLSAHQILAEGYDVIVCSYEFAESNVRAKINQKETIENFVATQDWIASKPTRPTSALGSEMLHICGIPWKVIILDEAQNVNKRHGRRHRALLEIPTKSWVILSGTLAHNQWHDIGGLLDFIKGHPYDTQEKFNRQFFRFSYGGVKQPGAPQITLLQRVLMAFTIIHPQNTIKLPPCKRYQFNIELSVDRERVVSKYTDKYRNVRRIALDATKSQTASSGSGDDSSLGNAIRAQLYSLHPALAPLEDDNDDTKYTLDNQDFATSTAAEVNDGRVREGLGERAPEKRHKWLMSIEEWSDDFLMDSPHLKAVVEFLVYLCRENRRKVVVFSQYLRYLDLINQALQKLHDMKPLRFDGTVPQIKRQSIQKTFEDPNNIQPLLITVGAGGTGLNLTCASIMLQTEEWWNENCVQQAISRLHRQGAEQQVMVVKFKLKNSAIDDEIISTRNKKATVNTKLLKPLIHLHDEPPQIPVLMW